MAITISSGAGLSLNSGMYAQLQQQQAQRNADQAERQASALQSQAENARAVAISAQENARSLSVQASQAQGDASSARQGLVALKSLGQVDTQLSGLREQISAALKPAAEIASTALTIATSASTLPPVINAFGQTTGTLVNEMA